LSAGRGEEIAALRQTVTQLTTALQQGTGAAADADAKLTWAQIVSDNHRLRADKFALSSRLNDVQTSLSEENKQLSKMVWFNEPAFTRRQHSLLCRCPVFAIASVRLSVRHTLLHYQNGAN